MENSEESFERNELKKSPTAWLVKCSQEQKEILQKKAAESGKTVAQFLVDAVQTSSIKEALSCANKETQREFAEIDGLLERLNHLIYAKVYTLIEKEKVAEDLKISLTLKENECEKDYEILKEKLVREFDEKNEKIKNECELILKEERKKQAEELNKKENELILSMEKIEQLEEKIKRLERDKDVLQKQYSESMRSYEIADDRLMECKVKIKDLEEKVRDYESIKGKNIALEKEVTVLQIKLESLAKEEALKREYLEKDLHKEFKIKLMNMEKMDFDNKI